MTAGVQHGRGRLTDADRARITELVDTGMGCNKIAREIGRHPSTVRWFMYTEGLKPPGPAPDKAIVYLRPNGTVVRRFCAEEDAFIQALRIQGYSYEETATYASKRFGARRSAHSVRCRLVMIAGRDLEEAC